MKAELVELSSVLSPEEFKRFGKFLNSPFFNTESRFIKLYDILKSSGGASREVIAKKMFGENARTTDARFKKLVSEFMKLFERFLGEIEFEADTFRLRLMTAKQLAERNLKNSYSREIKNIIKDEQSEGMKYDTYYLKMFEAYYLRYRVEGLNYTEWQNDLSIQLGKTLDRHFVAFKMFLFQAYISIEHSYKLKNEIERTFFNDINEYVQKNKEELINERSDIYLSYLMYNMFLGGNSKKLFEEYIKVLGEYEKGSEAGAYKGNYTDLLNYHAYMANYGAKGLDGNIIKLAEIIRERGYFKTGVGVTDFRIIIEAALRLGKISWAEEFAAGTRRYINEVYRNGIYNSYMAKIAFHKKDFSSARAFISKVKYEDSFSYAEARVLECRMLYEEKDITRLVAEIERTKKYVKIHKHLGAYFPESYPAFLDHTRRLIKAYEKKELGKDPEFEIRKLEEGIESRKRKFREMDWITEKINELKKN